MALYTIGDLHLSLGTDKPMDAFGGRWENYVKKITEGFSALSSNDTCVLCGDLSWAMGLDDALEDFDFLKNLPGEKIILKGNHDYWWNTKSKMNSFFEKNGFDNIKILHNNCLFYGDVAICGTRGWFYEEEIRGDEHDKKIMLRELMRLETSLKQAGEKEKFCFLHYPPMYGQYVCNEILQMLSKYDVKKCFYGHLHGASCKMAPEGNINGIEYRLVSADHINFSPFQILA